MLRTKSGRSQSEPEEDETIGIGRVPTRSTRRKQKYQERQKHVFENEKGPLKAKAGLIRKEPLQRKQNPLQERKEEGKVEASFEEEDNLMLYDCKIDSPSTKKRKRRTSENTTLRLHYILNHVMSR